MSKQTKKFLSNNPTDYLEHTNPVNLPTMLGTLTRDELRGIATHLGIPRGKNKQDTIKNLAEALKDGKKAYLKTTIQINVPPTPEAKATYFRSKGTTLLVKKFRNYRTDKVVVPVPDIPKAEVAA